MILAHTRVRQRDFAWTQTAGSTAKAALRAADIASDNPPSVACNGLQRKEDRLFCFHGEDFADSRPVVRVEGHGVARLRPACAAGSEERRSQGEEASSLRGE